MTVTFYCLDCGFRISVRLAEHEPADVVAESLSCGHCRCRRWATAA